MIDWSTAALLSTSIALLGFVVTSVWVLFRRRPATTDIKRPLAIFLLGATVIITLLGLKSFLPSNWNGKVKVFFIVQLADESGNPIRNAEVRLLVQSSAYITPADSLGRAVFTIPPKLAGTEAVIVAEAYGYERQTLRTVIFTDSVVRLVLRKYSVSPAQETPTTQGP